MTTCSNCGHESLDRMKFCTQCGKPLQPVAEQTDQSLEPETPSVPYVPEAPHRQRAPPRQPEPGQSLMEKINTLDREKLITIIGLAGILIVILAVFSLLEPIIQQIDLEIVIYVLLGTGIVLLVLGLFLILTERLNNLSKILIVTTGEILVLAITYLFDTAYRSALTRYIFLGLVVFLVLVGLYLPQFRPMDLFGSTWQLASIYLGFVSLISFGGSSYYSRLFFTLTVLVIILACHLAIFQSKSTLLLFWTIPLEFFTLLQSSVANSTYLFVSSVVIIASLPILLYFYHGDLPQISLRGQNIFEKALLVPQIALVFVITNGGLLPPLPEILTTLFIFIWMGYSLLMKNRRSVSETAESNLSIYFILIIALIGFTLSQQVITALILAVLVFLVPIIVTKTLDKLQDLMIVSSIVMLGALAYLYWIRVNTILLYGIALSNLFLHLLLTYTRYRSTIMNFSKFYQVWVSLASSFFLLAQLDLIFLLPLNLLIHLIFLEITDQIPLFGAILISFPAITAIALATTQLYQWLIIISQVIAVLYVLIRQRTADQSLALTVLLMPLIFVLSQVLSNVVVNTVLVILSLSAIYLYLASAISDNQIIASLFVVGSLILRDVVPAESGSAFGTDIEIVVMLGLVILFTAYHLIFHVLLKPKDHTDLSQLSWFVAVFYVMNHLHVQNYDTLTHIFFFSVTGILAFQLLLGRLRSVLPRFRLLYGILLFFLPVFFSTLVLYYLPWLILAAIQLLDNFTQGLATLTIFDKLYRALTAVNLVFLAIVQSWFAMASPLVLLVLLIYHGQIKMQIQRLLSDQQHIVLVLGYSIFIGLMNGILRDAEVYSVLQSLLFYGISTVLLLGWLFTSSPQGLRAMFGVYFAFSGLFLLQIMFIPLWIGLITIVAGLISLIGESSLRQQYTGSLTSAVNPTTLSTITILLVMMVELGSYFIYEGILGFQQYNQWLVGFGLFLIVVVVIAEVRSDRTYLTSSLLMLGSLTFIVTTFFGFYDVSISNLLFSTMAIITASLGLYFRKQDIFRAGIGLSALSLFKAVLDTLILDEFNRALSWLMVGIQLIYYVIIISNLDDDHFQVSRSKKEDDVDDEPAKSVESTS